MVKSQAFINMINTTLGYKKNGGIRQVLANLNLDFYPGDFIGVVGLNGSGKSTLLRSICGLLPVLEGEIILEGESISKITPERMAKKAAIVLTERIGGFNLNVFDTVAAGQIPYTDAFHRLTAENISVIKSTLTVCGIVDYQYTSLHELSDGFFQKTMIARALAQQTPCMLLDEPSAFLDYASRHELFIFLNKLASQNNKCILVSSHDLDFILKYCQRVLVVSQGTAHLLSVSEARKDEAFMKIGGGYI